MTVELDVRNEIPARRHQLIFETYGSLAPSEAFELVNDHDPKPLYHQFAAEHAGEFEWTPVEEGPEVWRIRIARTERAEQTEQQAAQAEQAAPAADVWLTSLITATPQEGFALAVTLSRRGVKTTQPDPEVLHKLRPEYANDADSLTAASQVVAINFQTVAAANNYWRHSS